MDRKEDIESIIGLMNDLMVSTKAHEPHPWLRLELTREQLRLMFLLSFKGRSSPGEVAASFGVPKANVTGIIARLADKGLISRQENPDDRRSYTVCLTEEGKSRVEQLRAIGAARIREVLGRMPDRALTSLRVGLEALTAALEDGGEANGHN